MAHFRKIFVLNTQAQPSVMLRVLFVLTFSMLALGVQPQALAQTSMAAGPATAIDQLCPMIESAARANTLPVDFFTRLIWQESRFRADEIGPVTRTGERALGIAQFMPGTALERGLFEPFNPVEALPKSGEFLAELRDQFGNLGLAAAAYNAGPQRVRDYIAGLRDLPLETRNYVRAITGHSVEDWARSAKDESNMGINGEQHRDPDGDVANCPKIMALLNRSTNPFIAEMELKVPAWCRYLQHPNVGVCGPIHERQFTMSAPRLEGLRGHLPALGRHRADTLRSVHLTGLRY